MLLYFAAPAFSQAEKEFNKKLIKKIDVLGVEVFCQERDGADKEERRKTVFKMDRDKILAADIFLFVLDGRVPDEGASVKLGIAYADKCLNNDKKLIVGLMTDIRTKLDPTLKSALDIIADSEYKLIDCLKSYIFNANKKQCNPAKK